MRLNIFALHVIVLLLACGCSYPSSTVNVIDDRPTIAVKGAPSNSVLYVDGLSMGLARKFNGSPKVLLLESGTHKIEVISNGKAIFSSKVFLGEGAAKTIKISGAGSR